MALEIKDSVMGDDGKPASFSQPQEETPSVEEPQETPQPENEEPDSSLETEKKEEPQPEAEKGDDPKAEEVVEDKPAEPTPEPEAPVAEDEELTDDEVFEVLSERLPKDTGVKSLQDLVDRLKKPEPLPEALQKQKEWLDNGGTLEEFYHMNMVNYDEMSHHDIVRMGLKEENPELSDAEIQAELEDEYGLLSEDHEDYDEKSAARGLRKLKKDSQRFKNQFKSKQEQFKADLSQPKPSQEQVSQEEAAKNQQAFIKDYTSAAKDLQGIEFEDGFKFSFDSDYKSKLEAFTSQGDPLSEFVSKDGVIDHKGLARNKAVNDNLPNIVKSAIAYGKSLQNKETVDQAKNPSFTPEQKSNPTTKKTEAEQIMSQIPSFNNFR